MGKPAGDHAAVAHGERRFRRDGPPKRVRHFGHGIQRLQRLADQRRVKIRRAGANQRNRLQRGAQRKAVPGIDRFIRNPAQQPLHVVHIFEMIAKGIRGHRILHQRLHGVQPLFDLRLVQQRTLDPRAQQAAAHGSARAVENPQKRTLARLSARRLGQLKIPQRHAIQRQIPLIVVGLRSDDVRQRVLLGIGQILQQRARRADRRALVGEAHFLNRLAEMRPHALRSGGIPEGLLLHRAGKAAPLRLQLGEGRQIVDDHLAGIDARQLVRERRPNIVNLIQIEFARGDVAQRAASEIPAKADRQDVVRPAVLQHVRLDDRARRDHAGDLPLHQSLGQRRIGHLLADGHLVALRNQLLQIGLHGVERNAAHRRALAQAAVAAGQRQFQLLRNQLRVVEEHLIEIAQPEEQDRVRILLLDLEILLHHGRKGHRGHLILSFVAKNVNGSRSRRNSRRRSRRRPCVR